MLDYYVDIKDDDCETIQVFFDRNGNGIGVRIKMGAASIDMSGAQMERLLVEYDKFLQACKCVEVVGE